MKTCRYHLRAFPCLCSRALYLPEESFYMHPVHRSLQLTPWGHYLTAWLWKPKELAFLIPWDCNDHKGAHTPVRHSNFYGSYPGIPLHHLALAASGAYTCGSHRTVANRERVLKQLPGPSQQEAKDPRPQSFCYRGLLANHHGCSLRGRLLIKHTSMG